MDRLEGEESLKRRLRIVLETLSGQRTIVEACAELRVSHSRFHELRQQVLEGALQALAPGAPGRPPRDEPADAQRQQQLEEENRELKVELQATRVRTEIAIAMPHLLTAEGRADIKKKARAAKKALRRKTGAPGSDT